MNAKCGDGPRQQAACPSPHFTQPFEQASRAITPASGAERHRISIILQLAASLLESLLPIFHVAIPGL